MGSLIPFPDQWNAVAIHAEGSSQMLIEIVVEYTV